MSSGHSGLSERVCVVTGATSGIGLETARGLAHMGATLALVARDPAKAEAVVRQLQSESGNPRIRAHIADLALLEEVRRLSDELSGSYPKLHVLVNNAGAVFFRREVTREGIERTWALNVLSPFLLTQRLIGRLSESAPARVVNVASAAHEGGHLNLDDPEGLRRYSGFGAYSQSKLALVMWSYGLAERLDGRVVSVNALHPGFVATRFGQNNGGFTGGIVRFLAFLFAIRPKKGARTPIFLASSPAIEGLTGRYYVRERPAASSAESQSPELSRALWAHICRQTGVDPNSPAPPRVGNAPSGPG